MELAPHIVPVLAYLERPVYHWSNLAITKRTVSRRFRQLQNAAGINKSRQWAFQSFRKTHLTMLAGLSLEHEQGRTRPFPNWYFLELRCGVYLNA